MSDVWVDFWGGPMDGERIRISYPVMPDYYFPIAQPLTSFNTETGELLHGPVTHSEKILPVSFKQQKARYCWVREHLRYEFREII